MYNVIKIHHSKSYVKFSNFNVDQLYIIIYLYYYTYALLNQVLTLKKIWYLLVNLVKALNKSNKHDKSCKKLIVLVILNSPSV